MNIIDKCDHCAMRPVMLSNMSEQLRVCGNLIVFKDGFKSYLPWCCYEKYLIGFDQCNMINLDKRLAILREYKIYQERAKKILYINNNWILVYHLKSIARIDKMYPIARYITEIEYKGYEYKIFTNSEYGKKRAKIEAQLSIQQDVDMYDDHDQPDVDMC